MASFCVMLALITPSVMKAVTRVFRPPSPVSLMMTLARVPSSKTITRFAQFSTSMGFALIQRVSASCSSPLGGLAVDQVGGIA